MSEKLQKILARAGLGSRREVESMISSGRVSVNGVVATLGDRLDDLNAHVRLDGHSVKIAASSDVVCRVLAYNKPEGELCTRSDPEGRKTVFDRLPRLKDSRWVAVGRLDANTSGMLLFTTDGELANRLMHPSRQIQREYMVRVFGDINEEMVRNLVRGVDLEDGKARFEDVMYAGGEGANHTFYVVITEGRNREVRRLWESQGVTVSRLKRVPYGDIYLGKDLPRGGWMELELDQVNYLRTMVDLRPEKETFITPESRKRKAHSKKIRRAVRRFDDRNDNADNSAKPVVARRKPQMTEASNGKQTEKRAPFSKGKPSQSADNKGSKRTGNAPSKPSGRTSPNRGKPSSTTNRNRTGRNSSSR